MSIKKEALNDIDEIWKIIQITNECFQFCKYLNYPPTEEERNYLSKKSVNTNSFKLLSVVLWQHIIIEFAKLFRDTDSSNDKYSLYKFIEKCKPNNYFRSLKVDLDTITKWEVFLKKNKHVVDKIIAQRDKAFAHRDRIYKQALQNNEMYFEELEPLITFTQNIIAEVYKKFNAEPRFNNDIYFNKDRYSVISDLAKYQTIKEKAIFDKYKSGLDS